MPTKKELNTTDVLKKPAKTEAKVKAELEKTAKRMKQVEMVDLIIPEAYRGAFGDPVRFSVNGVRIEVPIGKSFKVPKPHYLHAQRLMRGAVISKNQKRLKPEEVYKD